jgi:NitT/TauT family transport system ATP-binding protein
MIVLDHVSFRYEGNPSRDPLAVVNDVSLSIEPGEFLCIVGASGCGKTTLLRLIAGLLTPSAGNISVHGREPAAALKTRAFGFVFQDPVLFPWRTAQSNIALPFEVSRIPVDNDRIREFVDLVELTGYEAFYPQKLSGGMRSRVAIARALVYEPKILLMDEPFGDLDEVTRQKLHRALLRIWKRVRCTVVFVTHSAEEAGFLGDRVVVMKRSVPSISKIIDIGFPNKDFKCFRNPKFQALKEEVVASLDIGVASWRTFGES